MRYKTAEPLSFHYPSSFPASMQLSGLYRLKKTDIIIRILKSGAVLMRLLCTRTKVLRYFIRSAEIPFRHSGLSANIPKNI